MSKNPKRDQADAFAQIFDAIAHIREETASLRTDVNEIQATLFRLLAHIALGQAEELAAAMKEKEKNHAADNDG